MTKPLYFWNGSSFELVGPTTPQSPFAYQTSAPTAPATGDIWIDSDGDVDTYNRQLTRYYFVASAGQTSVSGTDVNGLTLAYVAGSEQVYVNGALQVRGVDYTATNGTSITGLSALALNDVVEVFAYTAFTVANAYTKSETDGVAAAATGLRMVVPTSVAVGSGSGSVDAIGNVTFSGASTVSINNCFSSTYDTYKIVFNYLQNTSTAELRFRMRLSGTDSTGTVYYFSNTQRTSASTTVTNGGALQTSFSLFAAGAQTASEIFITSEISKPALAVATNMAHLTSYVNDGANYASNIGGGWHNVNTAYDGFTVYPTAGTITGTIRIYGYKD